MSTPATIILKNSYGDGSEKEIARIYRHWDGNPGNCGKDIATAAIVASRTGKNIRGYSQLNNRNWAQHFLAAFCTLDHDIEFIDSDTNIWSDYVYVITGKYDDFGGKTSIDAETYLYRIGIECYDSIDSIDKNAPMYLGCVEAFNQWCDEHTY